MDTTMNRFSVSRAAAKQLDVSIRKSVLRAAALNQDSLCTKSPHVESMRTNQHRTTLCGLIGASLLAATLVGCEAPREPNPMDQAAQNTATETAVDTIPNSSPSLEAPPSSSGTTFEPLAETAANNSQNKSAADELLKKTINPSADAAWGDWAVDTATINGEAMPRDVAATISLFIDATTYIANVGDQVDKGTVVIRRNTTPMELDITGVEGPNAGKTILAIFEQPDANTLVVCYSFSQTARPTEFSSTAENGQFLVKYKRKPLN